MRFDVEKFNEIIGEVGKGRVILIESVGDLGLRLALGFLKNAIKEGYDVYALVPKKLKNDLKRELGNANILIPNREYTLHELFTISLVMRRMEEKVGLIDILQPLLIIHSPEKIYQLFQEICDVVRDKEGILLVIIDKKIVSSRILAMFEGEADYVIEIEEVVDGLRIRRGIRVKKSPENLPTNFYELIINGKFMKLGDRID